MSLRTATGVLILLAALDAAAEPAPSPSEADLALAKQYFVLGKTYYDQGSYEKALEAFNESYKHSRKAALLYNIAKCYESLGELEPAIAHYERYLAEGEQEKPTIAARVANLRARLERAQAKAAASARPATATTKPIEPKARPSVPKPRAAPLAKRVSPAPRPRKPANRNLAPELIPSRGRDTSWGWMTWTGWGLVGVGVASIVTSIVFGARASSKAGLMEDALACSTDDGPSGCPAPRGTPYEWSTVKTEIDDPGKKYEIIQIATLVAGLISGGAGATLLLLAPRRRPVERAAIVPLVDRHASGIAGTFSF